jgi:phosphoribosylformimino-5-aminoimidazole carboxamide ribotide isomerase
MLIIPAIDLIEGKCVRLTKGDYSTKKEYNSNPLDVALEFQDAGLTHLHLVDLDGAKQKKIVNYKVLETLATKTQLHIDFGGGIQSDEDIKIAFESGAAQITGGSIAVKNQDLFSHWLKIYGTEKIILGADVKNDKVAVSGWEETSSIWIQDLLEQYTAKGIKYVISTDIAKDGMLEGASIDLYQRIKKDFPNIHLIASGGVSSMQDLEQLAENGLYAAIVGKAIYEKRVTLAELSAFSK